MTTGAEDLRCEVHDHVAVVVLDRPRVLNALTTPMLEALVDVFRRIDDDSTIRCVVMRGNGRAFSVGADMHERRTMSLDEVRRRRRIGVAAFSAARNCLRPVIGQAHGYALGSGLELFLGCDITLAAEGTTMGLVETKLAAIPAGGGTQLLPRLVGVPRAKELILTGRRFPAEAAHGWGMINRVVPEDRLEDAAMELAAEIAESSPIAVAQAKRAIDKALDLDLRTGMEMEAALYERILTSDERAAAVRDFDTAAADRSAGEDRS